MIKAIIFDLGNTLVSQETGNAFPYAIDVLTQLKTKYKLGLITNVTSPTNSERVQEILENAGIADVFEVVVVSSEVWFSKPYRRIFVISLNRLKVEPDEAVMIGNTVCTDIFGGNRVGMKTIIIHIDEEYESSEWEIPDHTIHSLKELLEIV